MVRRERQRGYDGEARAARERHSKAVNQNVCRGVAHLGVQTSKQDERGRLVTPPRVIMGLCKTTGGGGSPHSRHNKGPGHQQEIPSCSMRETFITVLKLPYAESALTRLHAADGRHTEEHGDGGIHAQEPNHCTPPAEEPSHACSRRRERDEGREGCQRCALRRPPRRDLKREPDGIMNLVTNWSNRSIVKQEVINKMKHSQKRLEFT